jgi:acyl dehydratase
MSDAEGETELSESGFVIGRYEDALPMVGVETEPFVADVQVNRTTMRQYCSVIEDANPAYWDDEFAERELGGLCAPPGTMMVWGMKYGWTPDRSVPRPPLMGMVPLPGDTAINVSSSTEFVERIRMGDEIAMTECLVELSEPRRTRVGLGHFLTTLTTYRRRSDNAVLARQTNVLFRFRSEVDQQGSAA